MRIIIIYTLNKWFKVNSLKVFGGSKNFQAVFNVGYFMKLPDKDKRSFILDLTKKVDREDLFFKLGGKESDIKKYRINFDDDSMYKELLSEGRN